MDSNDRRWMEFDGGTSIGETGSEGGAILLDEEYQYSARITLEAQRNLWLNKISSVFTSLIRGYYFASKAPYSITCGIYGWMVHTRFFAGEGEARAAYEEMKSALTDIVDRIPLQNDPEVEEKSRLVVRDISEFVARFP